MKTFRRIAIGPLAFLLVLIMLHISATAKTTLPDPPITSFTYEASVWHVTYGAPKEDNGDMNCDTHTIRLDVSLDSDKQKDVLMHEIMHIPFCHTREAIGVQGGEKALEKWVITDEAAIRYLSDPVRAVLKQNPALAEYLLH